MATQKKQFYKHPQYGTVYGEALVTPTGRCAWPALVKPQDAPAAQPGQQQGAPRYGITIILPKGDKVVEAWIKGTAAMVKDMLVVFNDKRPAKMGIENVLQDGDDGKWDLEKYPYYKNSWLLTARNVQLPPVVDGQRNEIPVDAILGGMFVRATVTPLLTGHGISFKLNALQRVKDDDVRFGGANRAGSYVDMIPDVEAETEAGTTEEAAPSESPADGSTAPVEVAPPVAAPKSGKAKALAML